MTKKITELDSMLNELSEELDKNGSAVIINGTTNTIERLNVNIRFRATSITERKYDEKEFHLEFDRVLAKLPTIAKQLAKDKYTRQAICINWKQSKLPACNVVCQFIYRDGKLHLFNYLRSSNIDMLKNDIISLKAILQKLSKITKMKPGDICIYITSLHKYV